MKHARTIYHRLQQYLAVAVIVSLNFVTPLAAVHAQDTAVDASGNPTGPAAVTGAISCTGAECYQGADQGTNQGLYQGLTNGVTATNENTGADSDNQNEVTADTSTTTDIGNLLVPVAIILEKKRKRRKLYFIFEKKTRMIFLNASLHSSCLFV